MVKNGRIAEKAEVDRDQHQFDRDQVKTERNGFVKDLDHGHN